MVFSLSYNEAFSSSIQSELANLEPGIWYEIPDSTIKSALSSPKPGGNLSVMAYSGGAFDTKRNALLVWGGGHGDYFGNELYRLDLDTLDLHKWMRVWGPDPLYTSLPPMTCGSSGKSDCESWIGESFPSTGLQTPSSRHSYDSLVYVPQIDSMLTFSGIISPQGSGSKSIWKFDFETPGHPWTLYENTLYYSEIATTAYDPARQVVYAQTSSRLHLVTPDPWSVDMDLVRTPSISTVYATSAIDPGIETGKHYFVTVGSNYDGTSRLTYWDLDNMPNRASSDAPISPAVSGGEPIMAAHGPGFVYYPPGKCFVAWSGAGANRGSLWTLDHKHAGTLDDPWIWREIVCTGPNLPSMPMSSGTYGRFAYDAANDLFVLVNNINENVYVYRLPIAIPLQVTEPSGLTRESYPVTTGVPLPSGSKAQSWSLWEGGTEIPSQTTLLQGRIANWLLIDFQAEFSPAEVKHVVLRNISPKAVHPSPLSIDETEDTITIDTGIAKFEISKLKFNLFDKIWYDANTNGSYDDPGEQQSGASDDAIILINAENSQVYSGKGQPTSIQWEDKGPLRTTLKLEGIYVKNDKVLIKYTTRLTFWAGRSDVKLEHILRNSNEESIYNIKVQSATLKIGNGFQFIRNAWPGAFPTWANALGLTFEIIPDAIYHGAQTNTSANGGMVIPDLSHFAGILWFDLQQGLGPQEQADRTEMARSPIMALADADWYASHGAITQEPGSLLDESSAYAAWGWSFTPDQSPAALHDAGYHIDATDFDVHNDTESDDLWQNLVMYLRTGSRGYFDRAIAWARYYKREYSFRTDGWIYNWQVGNSLDNPTEKNLRPETINTALNDADKTYLRQFAYGRADFRSWAPGCHLYGWGLVDWYYLTGDKEALDAARDSAEITDFQYSWQKPGNRAMNFYEQRVSRQLLTLLRVWEATNDDKWGNAAATYVALWMQSPDWDSRGFYWNNYYGSGIKVTNTWQAGILAHGLYRFWKNHNDTAVRRRIVDMAAWFRANRTQQDTHYAGSRIRIDDPVVGTNSHNYWYPTESNFGGPQPTYSMADLFTIAYRLSGERNYLDCAMEGWNYGSKTAYGTPIRRTHDDNEVARFVNGVIGKDCYQYNGDLPYVGYFFRKWALKASPPETGLLAPTHLRKVE